MNKVTVKHSIEVSKHSPRWNRVAQIGPFILPDKPEKDAVSVMKCSARNQHGIDGSKVVRFEPSEVWMVESNYTTEVFFQLYLHISFPKGVKIPEINCQTRNFGELDEEEDHYVSVANSGDKDWILLAHVGPYSVERQPPSGMMAVWSCHTDQPEAMKFEPAFAVFDESNFTSHTYFAVSVKGSYPETQPLPEPKCRLDYRTKANHNFWLQGAPPNPRPDRVTEPNRFSQIFVALAVIYVATLFFTNSDNSKTKHNKRRSSTSAMSPKKNLERRSSSKASGKHEKNKSKSSPRIRKEFTTYSESYERSGQTPSPPGSYDEPQDEEDDISDDEDEDEVQEYHQPTCTPSIPQRFKIISETPENGDEWETVGQPSPQKETKPRDKGVTKTRFTFKRNRKHQTQQASPATATTSDETTTTSTTTTTTTSQLQEPSSPDTNRSSSTRSSPPPSECGNIHRLVEEFGTPDTNGSSCFLNTPVLEETDEIENMLAECAVPEPIQVQDESYTFVLHIHGMTCDGSENVVRSTLQNVDDVGSVVVDWTQGTARLTSPVARLDLCKVVESLHNVGFRAYLGPSWAQKTKEKNPTAVSRSKSISSGEHSNEIESKNSSFGPPPGFLPII